MGRDKSTLEQLLVQCRYIYIVGAQSRAKTLSGYIKLLYPNVMVAAYLVDDLSQNDVDIQGIPVNKRSCSSLLHTDFPVFIATKGIYHFDIQKELLDIGFHKIIPVTVEVDNWLRNAYVRKYFEMKKRPFQKLDQLQLSSSYNGVNKNIKTCIYMAKSIYDRPLQISYNSPPYERAIQVGAALTSRRLEPDILTDCEGDNISCENRQFSELTALYWVWKHAKEDIIGLCHYRRHFVLPQNWEEILEEQHIDVVLPVPTYVSPNVEKNYRERHDSSDWDFMMQYLKNHYIEDYKIAEVIFSESLYSSCNMLIVGKNVLDELCTWMFPILFAIQEHGKTKEDIYQNRYPGFLSERLITLFFAKNSKRYNIVYADKTFLH